MNRHLGSDAGAFADGALDTAQMARAWTHYRACAFCQEVVEGQREVRSELRKLKGLHIPPDVLNALYAIAAQTAKPASVKPTVRSAARATNRPLGLRTRRVNRKRPNPRYRAIRSVTVVGSLVVALLSGLWMLGGALGSGQMLIYEARSALNSTNGSSPIVYVENSPDRGRSESDAILDWLHTTGWTAMPELPDGFIISTFDYTSAQDGSVVSLGLTGPDATVQVTWRHAALDTAELGGLARRNIGGRTVYVDATDDQLAGVWQTGDGMAAFVCQGSPDSLSEVIEASLPATEPSISTRISRGWQVVTSTLGSPKTGS